MNNKLTLEVEDDSSQYSTQLLEFMELLRLKDYDIDTTFSRDTLKFVQFKMELVAESIIDFRVSDDEPIQPCDTIIIPGHEQYTLDEEKVIKLPKGKFRSFAVKRKIAINKSGPKWYPKFDVSEIYFRDKLEAGVWYEEINRIINLDDLMNEKNYDYVVQNGNKLIYVSTGTRAYMEITFSFKDDLEAIVNAKANQ